MPANSKASIYFSYAWGDNNETGESREKIVNDLYESLIKDGYTVVRDKADLGYKGLISHFMEDIGKGNCIVLVISGKYLKSPNCMFELLEIYRKSNSDIDEMNNKIFPIILNDAKIYDPIDRLDYVAYWKAKKEALDKKISEVGLEYAADVVDDFKFYREVTANIGLLASLLKDINTLNAKELSSDNFAAIKKEIEKLVANDTQLPEPGENSVKSYNLAKFRKFLENAITDAELNSLCMDYFEEVYNRFTDGMNKLGKINLLLDFCKRRLKLDELMEAMKNTNDEQFEQFKPYYN